MRGDRGNWSSLPHWDTYLPLLDLREKKKVNKEIRQLLTKIKWSKARRHLMQGIYSDILLVNSGLVSTA